MGEAEKVDQKKAEERKLEREDKGKEKKGKDSNGVDKKDEKKVDGSEKKSEKNVNEKNQERGAKDNKASQHPPDVIIMRVYMHCEGCARSVRRSLRGQRGVEEVKTDCRTHEVTVKGKADPLAVVDRVQRKSGRKVELLTPIPPKPEKEEEKPKPEKTEEAGETTAVLKVHMHCEACSLEIKRRILRMKGIRVAEADVKKSQVTVTGVFETEKLLEYVYKRTGKHAVAVKAEKSAEKKKDEKVSVQKESKEGEKEVTRNLLQYNHPRYQIDYSYAPQIFSDENPNACRVM